MMLRTGNNDGPAIASAETLCCSPPGMPRLGGERGPIGAGFGGGQPGPSTTCSRRHEPFPAFVVDRHWNLLRAQIGGAARLVEFLTGPAIAEPASEPVKPGDRADVAGTGYAPLIAKLAGKVAVHFLRDVQVRRGTPTARPRPWHC